MNSTTDKIKAVGNEAVGSMKQTAGKALGNPSLKIEGATQKLKVEAQGAIADAKDAVKTLVDKV
jgi:uncharacterized protein YjbJ (UPF0337 family)